MANTTSESPWPTYVAGGSIFTQDTIEVLTAESSPLNSLISGHFGNMDPDVVAPMQPLVPTGEQTSRYDDLCRSITEISEDIAKQTRYAKYVPINEDLVDDSRRKAGHRFKEMYVDANEDGDPQEVASLFLHTCAAPWAAGHEPSTYRLIKDTAGGEPTRRGDVKDPAAVMAFRWELGQLADYLVQTFRLPRPNGDPCLLWEFDLREYANDIDFRVRWGYIMEKLKERGFEPRPTPEQRRGYHQFSWYFAFALAAADLTKDHTNWVIDVSMQFIADARFFHAMKVLNVAGQREEGPHWMASIGRGVHRYF